MSNIEQDARAVHELKTIQPYFDAVEVGSKTFEFRKNDRDFQEGDTVVLREYDPKTDTYSGRELTFEIGFILVGFAGIEKGYCIFSLI